MTNYKCPCCGQETKDIYSLEWRKPTEQDIGKMCWFKTVDDESIILSKLFAINMMHNMVVEYVAKLDFNDAIFDCCILADHGQICPDEESFNKVCNAEFKVNSCDSVCCAFNSWISDTGQCQACKDYLKQQEEEK